jgi:antitoxin PrlF
MGFTTALGADGRLAIPQQIRAAARLKDVELFDVEVAPGGIFLRLRRDVDPNQAWFWEPEWQEGEREATAEGEVVVGEVFESGEDFLSSLKERRMQGASVSG